MRCGVAVHGHEKALQCLLERGDRLLLIKQRIRGGRITPIQHSVLTTDGAGGESPAPFRLAFTDLLNPRSNSRVGNCVSQAPSLLKWRVVILTRPRRKDLPGKTTVELFLEMLAGLSG